jgi:LEA14-like dessication related protein
MLPKIGVHGVALLLPVLAVVACATWRGIEEPEVSLTRVASEETGLFEQKLDVGLRIQNPNDFPLEVYGIRFDIEIDGEPVASGRDDTPFTIPAQGEHEVGVKARAQSFALLQQLVTAGTDFSYEVDGKLLLQNAAADEVDFEHTTRLDLD